MKKIDCYGRMALMKDASGELRRGRRIGLMALLLSALLAAVVFAVGASLEKQARQPQPRGDLTQRYAYGDYLEHGGTLWRRRSGLTTILLMGIDRDSRAVTSSYRNGGQADFLRLVVLDSKERTISQLQIDRDTMTPITILGVLGNRSGVRTAQICLSHGFGDGGAQSCELTVDAVSNLLCSMPVDFYAALNMDGISVLNDAVGGVTVTLEDDFSMADPAMQKGETLTLQGEQAEIYVRRRMDVGAGTNEARMKRQEEYIAALTALLDERLHQKREAAGELYDVLSPYLTTNISRGRLINEVWAARDYVRGPVLTLAGEYGIGSDGFMQFLADEDAVRQAVLSLIYEKVE